MRCGQLHGGSGRHWGPFLLHLSTPEVPYNHLDQARQEQGKLPREGLHPSEPFQLRYFEVLGIWGHNICSS